MNDAFKLINDPVWLENTIFCHIDRLSLLSILCLMELALRHPNVPDTMLIAGKSIGKQLLSRLILDGLEAPEDVLKSLCKTFDFDPEEDL